MLLLLFIEKQLLLLFIIIIKCSYIRGGRIFAATSMSIGKSLVLTIFLDQG